MDASESTVSPDGGAPAPSAEAASMGERVDEAASTETWLLYGATGRTGTLIAEQGSHEGTVPSCPAGARIAFAVWPDGST